MRKMALILAAAITILMVTRGDGDHQSVQAQSKARETFVSIDDIGRSVKIIGRLGIPLEELATVRGTWKPNPQYTHSKGVSEVIYEVTHVNGAALRQTVSWESDYVSTIFEGGDVKVSREPWTTWEVQVCETARLAGIMRHADLFYGSVPQVRLPPAGHLVSELKVAVPGKPTVPPSPVSAKGE